MGQPENCDPSSSGWYEVLEPNAIKERHLKKGHIYPVINDWFGRKWNPLAEFSEEANKLAASIKCRNNFYGFFKKVSATWIYICDLSISLVSGEICFDSLITECHFVPLGNLCPSSECWRSFQVPQETGNGWTAWRAVWGQNGCIPVRKGPQQDWRISTGFKCSWSWGFWWLGIQVQAERSRCLENMLHTA